MSGGHAEAEHSLGGPSPLSIVEDLKLQNQRLRQENEELRQRLEEERALRRSVDAADSHKALEAATYKDQIQAIDDKAEALALHSELLQLRQTCAVYAEATEESKSYFVELKRLYAELEKYLRPEAQ